MDCGRSSADDPTTIYIPPSYSRRRIFALFLEACNDEHWRRERQRLQQREESGVQMNVSEDEEEEDDEDEEEGGDERPLIEDEHFEDVFPAHAKVSELRAWSYSNFCVQ